MKPPIVTYRPKEQGSLPVSKTCQMCRRRHATTKARDLYTAAYIGPCGDSFCYASCDSESCRSVRMVVCESCALEVTRKKAP